MKPTLLPEWPEFWTTTRELPHTLCSKQPSSNSMQQLRPTTFYFASPISIFQSIAHTCPLTVERWWRWWGWGMRVFLTLLGDIFYFRPPKRWPPPPEAGIATSSTDRGTNTNNSKHVPMLWLTRKQEASIFACLCPLWQKWEQMRTPNHFWGPWIGYGSFRRVLEFKTPYLKVHGGLLCFALFSTLRLRALLTILGSSDSKSISGYYY
jgi:hypothetical protein